MLSKLTDGSGQPDERNSSGAHTVKEQHAHEVHREIASFNTDNEFNRKINEEDIDFNIPGLPHSTRETIAQCQRSRIDSENRELFNETYNKVSHLIPSAKNQKK